MSAVDRARARLASATDAHTRNYAVVRLVAELASEGVAWPGIEEIARELGEAHGIDCDVLLPLTRAALLSLIERRLAGEPCRCWACRRIS